MNRDCKYNLIHALIGKFIPSMILKRLFVSIYSFKVR